MPTSVRPDQRPEVLIVGAGPTGLALAAQLQWFGVRFRLIDRLRERGRESRALAVQARTLEVLEALGLGEPLVARGNRSTRLVVRMDGRAVTQMTLGEIGARDTRFPFILFVSQAETEAVLTEHLAKHGVEVERGVELLSFVDGDDAVQCTLRHGDGREEGIATAYLVGCDGAHSVVRKGAGIPFEGGSYPQEFVLGDVEADGALTPRAINSFAGRGVAMFFPLGRPTTWRVIAMAAGGAADPAPSAAHESGATTRDLTLDELQAIVDAPTGGSVRVRDPAWLTRFRLHHRQTARYRAGRVFLAGDAAHVHSPVGAQGMNTGIQDAWNLGWKLALVVRGAAAPRLLDTYEAERWPVGQFLLRYTDRIFSTFTRVIAGGRVAAWARRVVAPRVLPFAIGSPRLRAAVFQFVSELGIRYRKSPAVTEGVPRLGSGPRAGDRVPDLRVTLDGRELWLQETVVGPRLTLVLCGDAIDWDTRAVAALRERFGSVLDVRALTRDAVRGTLQDHTGEVLAKLGVTECAQYLVRPDGYIAFRCGGRDLSALERYMAEWYRADS